MQMTPEELERHGFLLQDTLTHQDLIPFVRLYLNKRTRSSIFYTAFNVAFVALLVFWFWKSSNLPSFAFGEGLSHTSIGIAITLALIPLHEYLHVLAYKWQGATNTSYDANFRKFYFMALADKFVANRKEFQVIALAPFVVISIGLLLAAALSGPLWTFAWLGALLVHTACCSGDFGLLSYFDFHKDKEVVTYDDKENGVPFFYGKSGQL